MSNDLINAVVKSDLPGRERSVLFVMANKAADPLRECYMSLDSLARESGWSKATVLRSVDSLVRKGWLSVISRHGGKGQPNRFIVNESPQSANIATGNVINQSPNVLSPSNNTNGHQSLDRYSLSDSDPLRIPDPSTPSKNPSPPRPRAGHIIRKAAP